MNNEKYQLVIGLEVHAQLRTASKLFCGDPTAFGADPNTQVSAISLAHPGTLPVMNEKVIELAVKLGLALGCSIVGENYFARKNYFYPDLPKGYQVSQHTAPICLGGQLAIETTNGKKEVKLNRIHMEEDAGKSLHDIDDNYTCIDLNRAGMPLLEIVTEPDMHSADEAFAYLTELRKLVRWLGVCDGNMEEGSMRCDANVSVRLAGVTTLGTRVEVKNLNSIRNVKRAIEVEAARLIEITENGQTIVQQTRSYDADNNVTFALRSKEEADDYRYFPEPDLPAFHISNEYQQSIREQMPMLPSELHSVLLQQYGLSSYDASILSGDKQDADLYLSIVSHTPHYKAAANWMTAIRNYCAENTTTLTDFPLEAPSVAALINYTETGVVSFNAASTRLMQAFITSPSENLDTLAGKLNILKESDEAALEQWVDEVISAMPEKVKEYQSGKKALIGLFAGEVKKKSKGKADMQMVNKILTGKLAG
jgi:aspartyl-tRNA(Asn)/glutamyl-tRNA(Gln) amidotransferase subunit B